MGTVLDGAHHRIRTPLFELRVRAPRQAGEVIDRGWILSAGSGTKRPPSFSAKQRRTPSGKFFKLPEGVLSIPSFFVTAIEPLTIIYRGHAHNAPKAWQIPEPSCLLRSEQRYLVGRDPLP